MKKIAALLLSAAILFSLAACGQKQAEQPAEPKIIRGTVENGVYRNKFADFSLALSTDCEFKSESELAKKSGISEKDFASGEAARIFTEDFCVIHDLSAIIRDEKAVFEVNIYNDNESADEHIDFVVQGFGSDFEENNDMQIICNEKAEASIDGKTVPYHRLDVKSTSKDSYTMKCATVVVTKEGFCYEITVSSFGDAEPEEFFSRISFSADGAAAESAESAESAEELGRGTVKDGVYTNPEAGVTITAPEGWSFASDSEIAKINGISADSYPKDGESLFANADYIYDAECADAYGAEFITVDFSKLSKEESKIYTDNDFLENINENYSSQEGVTESKVASVSVGGKKIPAVNIKMYSGAGDEIYGLIFVKVLDGAVCMVNVCAYDEPGLAAITDMLELDW